MTMDFIRRLAAVSAVAIISLVLYGPTGAIAQQTPQVITLEEAIQLALERNPTIRQSENSVRSSELNVLQQQRQLLPSLSLTSGTGVPYLTPNAQDPSVTAGLSASMQVGNIYSTVANMRQARINEDVSNENLNRSRQTIIFNVMSSYLALVESQDQISVQERNLATVEEQLRQVQRRVDVGERPISDLYQQQASVASARLSAVQTERGVIVSTMNLIRLLQLDPNGEYQFVRPELGPLSTSIDSISPETLSSRAFAQRPDLRASQLSVASAEQGLKVARASRWPSLSISLGYNSGSFNTNANGGFVDQWDRGRRGNLSLNLSVPVLNMTYGITKERAEISLENARISLENARQGVAIEVRTAYLDLQLAEEQLVVAQAQMEASELSLRTAEQRYAAGAATLLEQVQAQLAHQRAAITLVNAEYDLVFQSRLMAYYLGELQAAPN